MKPWVFVLVFAALRASAFAQERPPSSLFVSGELDSGPVSGEGGDVEWMQSISDQTSLVVGGASTSIGGQWWSYGRFGGFTKRRRLSIVGTTDLGGGASPAGHFPFSRYMGSLAAPLPGRFYAEGEAQYVLAAHAWTRVVKVGTAYVGLPKTALRVALFRSSTGSAAWKYVSGRGDVTLGRLGLATGLTAGTKQLPQEFNVVQLLAHTSQEVFAAVTIDSPRAKTIMSYETIRQPAGRIGRTVVTLNLPIRPRTKTTSEVPQ